MIYHQKARPMSKIFMQIADIVIRLIVMCSVLIDNAELTGTHTYDQLNRSLLIISPVTRCAATWPLELELKFFLSNNVHMSTATEMCTARS